MNASTFNRLHTLRMANDAAGFAMDEMRPRFDRLAKRHENGAAPRAVVAYQLFQTPPSLAGKMAALLDLQPGMNLLEPSAGLGALLDAVPSSCGEIVAVEITAQCARELFIQDRHGVTIKQRDFLAITPGEIGLFDRVLMNPPFHLRSDIRHILHARTFLKPAGKLVALCMDTPHRSTALRGISETWEQIPAGTFKSAGANIPTVLLTMCGENNRPSTRGKLH